MFRSFSVDLNSSAIRSVLTIVLGITLAAGPFQPAKGADEKLWANEEIPVTGEILPEGIGFDHLDEIVKHALAARGIPGAAVAITHAGKLVAVRGYGWADVQARKPVQPETLFGLASVSKPITAVTILHLVEQGKLKLDEPVFELLKELHAPPGHEFDSRLKQITIRMLLDHSGGWNRDVSGDPSHFGPEVEKELGVKPPMTIDQLILYMNGRRLDFDPGTQQHYSNYGFAILGRVIGHVTGEPYIAHVEKATFAPLKMVSIRMDSLLNPEHEATYFPDEAKRYLNGHPEPVPPGHVAATVPAGGWSGSAVALARFLTAVDGTRTGQPFLNAETMQRMLARPEPPLHVRKNGTWYGLGWDSVHEMPNWPHGKEDLAYGKDGGLPGTSTWIEHLPGGTDWVIFFNGTGQKHPKSDELAEQNADAPAETAMQEARKKIVELLHNVKQWPAGDLFEQYR